MLMSKWAWVLAASLLLGCAASSPEAWLESASGAGSGITEVAAVSLRIRVIGPTDERARVVERVDAAACGEIYRRVQEAFASLSGDAAPVVTVYVFTGEAAMHEFARWVPLEIFETTRGFVVHADGARAFLVAREPTLGEALTRTEPIEGTLGHELVHCFLNANADLPPWIHEALAYLVGGLAAFRTVGERWLDPTAFHQMLLAVFLSDEWFRRSLRMPVWWGAVRENRLRTTSVSDPTSRELAGWSAFVSTLVLRGAMEDYASLIPKLEALEDEAVRAEEQATEFLFLNRYPREEDFLFAATHAGATGEQLLELLLDLGPERPGGRWEPLASYPKLEALLSDSRPWVQGRARTALSRLRGK